jgi:hypothetical protein
MFLLRLSGKRLGFLFANIVCHSGLTSISGSAQTPTSSHLDLPPTGLNVPCLCHCSYLHSYDLTDPCSYQNLCRCSYRVCHRSYHCSCHAYR